MKVEYLNGTIRIPRKLRKRAIKKGIKITAWHPDRFVWDTNSWDWIPVHSI